ncbi:mobilization protein [Cupriavidus sp. CuC1]|uniref:mobilization protein n=1 Tax=Cupriavidus sp. CuC1 TaxID=3373131 RepID=UPI0037CE9953
MAAIENKIATLEAKLKQAKAEKQLIDARKRAAEQKRLRAEDTRRKILVGSLILAKVERGEFPRDKLLATLNEGLTRADDRALFDLDDARTTLDSPELRAVQQHLSQEAIEAGIGPVTVTVQQVTHG